MQWIFVTNAVSEKNSSSHFTAFRTKIIAFTNLKKNYPETLTRVIQKCFREILIHYLANVRKGNFLQILLLL